MTEQPPARPALQRGRPKRPRPDQRVRVLTLRVPEELLRRLDAYTAQAQAAQPYLRLSRADVIRTLLDERLSATREMLPNDVRTQKEMHHDAKNT
jgi:hypothetical protein